MVHSGEPVDEDALAVVRAREAEITFLGFERVIACVAGAVVSVSVLLMVVVYLRVCR